MTRWLSTITLVAALILGYTYFLSGERNNVVAITHTEIADYAITDAEVIETGIDGFTRVRFSATDASLSYSSNALALHNLRIDYQPSPAGSGLSSAGLSNSGKPTSSKPSARGSFANSPWVVKADHGTRTTRDDIVTLSGNVSVSNISKNKGVATPITLTTQSMILDMSKQVASNSEKTQVTLGQHVVTGNKLKLDLPTQQVQLRNGGQLRLAANNPADVVNARVGTRSSSSASSNGNSNGNAKMNAPDVFDFDESSFREGILHFINLRSKSPPYVRAAQATARGDMGNNEIELSGGVEFELPQQGNLVADSARVTIRDGHVAFAKVLASNGQMIVFEHHPPAEKAADTITIQGRAISIDYDLDANTLLMRSGRLSRKVNGETEFDLDCPIGNYNVATGDGGCRKTETKRPTTTIHLPKDSLPGSLPQSLPKKLPGPLPSRLPVKP